ncbi:hypothetical protein SBA6_690014 [Candidatus Sulfopaludibacter sp. SbA6]|nr:hypothetical protein SBA6_690014 [Candidatus Sulfopaludibacter sp. SbA6]
MVSRDGGRFHLDGPLLPAVVRRAWQDAGEISHLQRLEPMKLEIDINRLCAELDSLAGFSDAPAPAVTRVVFSEQDRAARRYVKSLCAAAGLQVREDAVGNTFARWPGAEPELAARAGARRHRHWLAHRRHPARRPIRRNGGRAGRSGSHPRDPTQRCAPTPVHRARDLQRRGAHALRHRLLRKPLAGRHSGPGVAARQGGQDA